MDWGYYFSTMAFFRAFIYLLICVLSFQVATSYWKAYCKYKPTWIIKSVMILFASLGFSFFFYALAGFLNFVEGYDIRYRFIVSILGLTNLPLLFSIANFWNASLNQTNNKKNRRNIKRREDCM